MNEPEGKKQLFAVTYLLLPHIIKFHYIDYKVITNSLDRLFPVVLFNRV